MRHPMHFVAAAVLAAASLPAQLAGNYTINPTLPATATNFPSLLAAVQALAAGVAGPVVFDVYDDAGPYTESHASSTTWSPSTAGLAFAQWPGVSAANRVTFRAAPGELPVIDAAGHSMGVYWNGADHVTLEGFEVMNATYDAISLYSDSTSGQVVEARIRGCRLHDCGAAGVTIYGNTPNPLNTLVENCFLWRLQTTNAGAFSTTARFGYVTTRRAVGTRIVHNTFFVDSGAGSLLCAIGSNGSSASEVTYAEVSNNVIYKTAAAGRPMIRYQVSSSAVAPMPPLQEANCWFDTTASPFAVWGPTTALNTANTLADWQTNLLLDLTSIAQDPGLLATAAGELHLGPLSPCIGGGLPTVGTADDIDGQPRVATFDMGADQFSSATIRSFGSGCAAAPAALPPTLGSHEWPFLGNASFAITVGNVAPGSFALTFIALGLAPVPLPLGGGCDAYIQTSSAEFIALLVAGPAGTADQIVALPANAQLQGTNIAFQEMVIVPTAPLGFVVSNALDIVVGF